VPGPDDASGDAAPADASPGDAPPADAPEQPAFTIHVAPTGDDANDGLTLPVKTLKHALGLAAANQQLTSIALASGRYSTASGETFPYTVPAGVFIVGPAGGGAILVGTKAEPGIIVDTGTLRDLEFEDFTVAITATGVAYVTNVRIRSSMVAMREETAARLTVDKLDITGTIAACATGIVLNGAADLTATKLDTRNLGTTLDAKDQSTVNIAHANITGDPGCMAIGGSARYVMSGNTTQTFMISDSILDNGSYGIGFRTARVTIVNTIIRNTRFPNLISGLGGMSMTGGALMNSNTDLFENGAPSGSSANATIFTNVTFTGAGLVAYWSENGNTKLVMRGCATNSAIQITLGAVVDLGTATNPGNNTFRSDLDAALQILDCNGPPIDAVGNTWRPLVQGANDVGRYPMDTKIKGPMPPMGPRTNYSIGGACVLNL
jgi:hypothetical protein